MRKTRRLGSAAVLAALLPLLLPVRALGSGEVRTCAAQRAPAGLRFSQPMLVPGATWTYRVLADVAEPAEVGKTVDGIFSTAEEGDEDRLLVTYDLPGERQILSADPFDGTIRTHRISNDSAGLDLSFSPPLVHFAYPFQLGDTWRNDVRFSGVLGGRPMEGEVSSVFQVLAEECIDTAAGGFPALVLENAMTFPSLGQSMTARLWVSANGLLLRRESWVGGTLTQILELDAYVVPMTGRLSQMSRELAVLAREVRAEAAAPFLLRWHVRAAQWEVASAAEAPDRHARLVHVRRAARALRAAVALSIARDVRAGAGSTRLTRGAVTMSAHLDAIEGDLRP